MIYIRFAAVFLLVSSALATPLAVKRQPWTQDLVNLYIRSGNSTQNSSNSTSGSSSNGTSSISSGSSNSSSSNSSSSSNGSSNSGNSSSISSGSSNSSSSNSSSSSNNSSNSSSSNGSSSSSNGSSSSSNSQNNGSNGSLNNYGGLQSMSGFDGFCGSGNFDCSSSNAQVIVIQKQQEVCHTQQIEVIQQKLVVLREMAKKIITEQVCDVETQTIVLEQFSSGISSFQNDIGRKSGKQVGYDANVAGLISNVTNSDGSLSTNDLGFNGTSVGSNTVVPSGSNWNDSTGPAAVANAANAAQAALAASNSSTSS